MKIKLSIIACLFASLVISCSDSIGPEITKIDFSRYNAFKLSVENFSFRNYHYIYTSLNKSNWESFDNLSYFEILGETVDSVKQYADTIKFVKYSKNWDTTKIEYLHIAFDSTDNSIANLKFNSYFGFSRIIGYHNSSTSANSTMSLTINDLTCQIVNDTLIIGLTGTLLNQYNLAVAFAYSSSTTINDLPTGSSQTSGEGYYTKELQPLFENSSFILKLYKK